MKEKDLSNLEEQAREMSLLWRNRVAMRMAELEAVQALPPLQRNITFGDYFSCKGELVGRIPSLTDFLQNAAEHEVSDDQRDFLTACALYDAHMGWYAADITTTEETTTAVVHVSMVFPISKQLHNAMVAVGCDLDRLNPSDQEELNAFIAADVASTEEWMGS